MLKNKKEIEKRKSVEKPIEYSNVVLKRTSSFDENIKNRIVEGYALIWGTINSHGERFVKGCCSKSINDIGPSSESNYKIKFRDEHGRVCSLFAELEEDEIGLRFKTVPLDNVSWSNDLLVQLKSGSINNFSIGFVHCWDKVEWDYEQDCLVCLEINLLEISAVAIPSELETYAIRSVEEIEYLNEDVKDFISSLPKSKQLEAKKIFARCFSLSETEQPKKIIEALRASKAEVNGNKKQIIKQLLKKLKDD